MVRGSSSVDEAVRVWGSSSVQVGAALDEALRQSIADNRRYRLSKFLPSRKALAVLAWLVGAVVLAVVAFGLRGLTGGGRVAATLALAHAEDIFRLAAFAGLGLLALFGSIWLWGEIRDRHTLDDVAIFVTCTGVVGVLLLLGAYVLKVDLSMGLRVFLVGGSSVLLFCGLHVIPEYAFWADPSPSPSPSPAARQDRRYDRKAVTTHGDARSADDWEIDEALRDKSGGFDPIFKD